ncbi:MAG: hypothetical protein GX372_06725 [Ignavibacteria bacterium]|jgi:hypothetical protein|nr:hypothetical protein [Ignavibacteria bacterium]
MTPLTITLKQHTPLIHFQHDQDGATLRASEVKPKLDRFILTKLGENPDQDEISVIQKEWEDKEDKKENEGKNFSNLTTYEKGILIAKYRDWLIGEGEHPALNYKMRIIDSDNRNLNEREGEVVIIPPNKEKTLISNDIKLYIIASQEPLRDYIEQHIEDFFIYNSFGKRNNKGFGNFYVCDEKNPITWEKLKQKLPTGTFIYENFIRRRIENKSFSKEYKFISDVQRKLKSGINYRDKAGNTTYIKSKLFVYSINQQMRWEKRWIKKQIKELVRQTKLPSPLKYNKPPNDYCNNLDINTNNGNCSYNNWNDNNTFQDNYFFIRILLGLPEHWEFLTNDDNVRYKVIPENDYINRFKSPLIFKVFKNNIYLLIDELPQDFSIYPFKFKVKIKRKKEKENGKKEWEDDKELIYFQDNEEKELTLYPPKIDDNYNLHDFISNSIQSLNFKRIEHGRQ